MSDRSEHSLLRAQCASVALAVLITLVGCKSSTPDDGGVDAAGSDALVMDASDAGIGDSGGDVNEVDAIGVDANDFDANIDAGPGGDMVIDVIELRGFVVEEGTITVGDRSVPIEAGRARLEGFPAGPLRGTVSAPGFAPANVFGVIIPGRTTSAQSILLPYGMSVEFPADEAVELRHAGSGVRLQANSFVDAAGDVVTGLITVHITSFDPETDMAAAPGPFRGMDDAGEEQLIETFGMSEFSFEAGGQALQLADGVTAEIDVSVPGSVRDEGLLSIPAWHYDLDAGRWIQEGLGSIVGTGERTRWVATVSHFSWWNADQAITNKECLNVTILNAVETVGVPVSISGLDYNGLDEDLTDEDGTTCVEFKRGSQASLFAGGGTAGFSYQLDVSGSGDSGACAGGGGSCGTVIIDAPPPTCMRGTVEVDGMPVEGARVVLTWGTDYQSTYTEPDGTFCTSVPVGETVGVAVSYFVPLTNEYYRIERTAISPPEAGSCGSPGACTDMGTLALTAPLSYCVDGTAQFRTFFSGVEDVPVGTPLYAFRAATFTGVDCGTRPRAWGAIIARGTVGAAGAYCLNLPYSDTNRDVVIAADGCDRMTNLCDSDIPDGFCYDADEFALAPEEVVTVHTYCELGGVECRTNDILFE